MQDNLPQEVRCLHPLVTLFDKLDAISRQISETYVRHCEDAARIVQACQTLPGLDQSPRDLAEEMRRKDIASVPGPGDASLNPSEERLAELAEVGEKIRGMYWNERAPIVECHGRSKRVAARPSRLMRFDRRMGS